MKMNKVKIVRAVVDGNDTLIIITLRPDGRKVSMTMANPDDDGVVEILVADDGFIVSKDEQGYDDYEEIYESEWDK